jgi:hypothetical protein
MVDRQKEKNQDNETGDTRLWLSLRKASECEDTHSSSGAGVEGEKVFFHVFCRAAACL